MSVALSANGDTLLSALSSAPAGEASLQAMVFIRGDGGWSPDGVRLRGDGSGIALIGAGLSADGKTAMLSSGKIRSGESLAWVFARGDGNTVLLVGPRPIGSVNSGTVWVFSRSADAIWRQQGPRIDLPDTFRFSSSRPMAAIAFDGSCFIAAGTSLDASTCLAARYVRTGDTWATDAPVPFGTGGLGNTNYGASIAISFDGRTVVSGSPGDEASIGRAWVLAQPSP